MINHVPSNFANFLGFRSKSYFSDSIIDAPNFEFQNIPIHNDNIFNPGPPNIFAPEGDNNFLAAPVQAAPNNGRRKRRVRRRND